VIIDFRCRVTTSGSADYFVDRMTHLGRANRIAAFGEGSIDAFFDEISSAGVTTAVSVSGHNPGAKLGKYDLPERTTSNDALAELQAQYPGRFVGVAGIDVSNRMHDSIAELERAHSLGLRAVCIEPGRAPSCLPNDRALYSLYERCEALAMTLIPQTSGVLGGRLVDYANPKYIEEIADDFPAMNIVCGHGCYPYVREAIVMASRRENVWLSPDIYFFHLGHTDWIQAINSNLLGFSERFIFGSSYPLTGIQQYVDSFNRIEWKTEVRDRIFFRNALRALRLENDAAFVAIYGQTDA
jgi:uncharacterized protein